MRVGWFGIMRSVGAAFMAWSVADPRGGCSEFDASGRVRKGCWWCHEMVSRTGRAGIGRPVDGHKGHALIRVSLPVDRRSAWRRWKAGRCASSLAG